MQLPEDPRCNSGRRDYTELVVGRKVVSGKDVSGKVVGSRVVSGKEYDIYNSEKRLESALQSLQTTNNIPPTNKQTITKFINSMKAQGIKPIRLKKEVYTLRDIAQILGQTFSSATKEDIERVLCEIESNGYSAWTKADYRIILKRFYKWLLGEDEFYPRIVSWIRNKEPKNSILPEELLSEEEILKLVDSAKFARDKAFIFTLYESGARIGELLTIRIKHISFSEPVSGLMVSGKTGQRRIPVIKCVPFLKKWLSEHPLKHNPDSLVWLKLPNRKGNFRKQGNRSVYRELCYSSVRKMLKKTFKRANINKKSNPHLFRHSRATHLANHLTESQLKHFFGWTQSSNMASRYVHLSGRDIDDAIREISK